MRYQQPHHLEVKKAEGKGLGVFTKVALLKGDIIEIAPTLVIPKEDDHDLLSTFLVRYIFKTDRGNTYVIGLGYSSLLNHSSSPNVDFSVRKHAIILKAIKNIAAGRELTINYGWTKGDWDRAGIIPVR